MYCQYWQKEQEETLRTDKDIFQNDTASSLAQQDNPECWVVIRFCDEYTKKNTCRSKVTGGIDNLCAKVLPESLWSKFLI